MRAVAAIGAVLLGLLGCGGRTNLDSAKRPRSYALRPEVPTFDASAPIAEPPEPDGAMATSCPAGWTRCGFGCADLQSDPDHCGDCFARCEAPGVCDLGLCVEQCSPALTECGRRCVHLTSNPVHCGACDHWCGPQQICVDGACSCGIPNPVDGASAVEESTSQWSLLCSTGCADLLRDPSNCGACAASCEQGSVCSRGACEPACADGLAPCAGGCVDLERDPNNCGGCGSTCRSDQLCSAGLCACPAGWADCDGDRCVDLQSDVRSCGACGNRCAGTENCRQGACTPDGCAPGESLCGGSCIDTTSNPNHCGACGVKCTGGQRCNGTCSFF